MQRYIYGNLHHAGYRTVSSDDTNFFMNHAGVLAPLMYYDSASRHGDLPQDAYKCFWMLTTDLGIIGGKKYLFLQESGLDFHRATAVVQGYRSDFTDGELYGPRLLEILDTDFVSSKEAMNIAEAEDLKAIHVSRLPRKNLSAASMRQEVLEGILLTLLLKRRVILRIPASGAAAMAESRRYLQAIYQRLPYEIRQNNGCLTGATAPMLNISQAFTIILMDGDADISGIVSDSSQAVFDLTVDAVRKIPKEQNGKTCYYVPLIEFLTTEPQEKLDAFFAFCQTCLEGDANAGYPGIRKYSALLDVYNLDQKPLSGEEIRKWAVNLHDSSWSENMHTSICRKIAAAMSTEDLLAYLKTVLPRYENLAHLGFMSTADRYNEKDTVRDQNAALTLRMMLRLPGYDLESIRNGLVAHFTQKAKEQYPCLTETMPSAITLAEQKAIPLPQKLDNANPWLNRLKEDVRTALDSMISQAEALYNEQFARQKAAGETQCKAWPAETPGCDPETLYQQLQGHYLYEELISGWNQLVAQRIVAVCLSFDQPRELAGYKALLAQEQSFRNCLHAHGGGFIPEQDRLLRERTEIWQSILDLCGQTCTSASDLDRWLQAVDAAEMHRELAQEQKEKKARELLLVIPEDLPLPETKQRLKSCIKHKALLGDDPVWFKPWGVKCKAEQLLNQIERLQRYRRGHGKMPMLNNAKLCNWITVQLPENKDLMMLLILQKPEQRTTLVKILAQKSEDITVADLRELYISGCSRKCLCEDVGQKTSAAWRSAMDAFLPALPELPEPLKAPPPQKRTIEKSLLLTELILLGLAAVIPAAVMLILGSGTVIHYSLTAAVLAIFAAGFAGTAFAVKSKKGKRFLFGLAIALTPGILVTIAAIILCLI